MKIEWDETKNLANIKKHHIYFEDAALVFLDIFRIEMYDELHSLNENRYITIGKVHDILYVVYTEREESIRLISARRATKTERSWYYDTINNHYR